MPPAPPSIAQPLRRRKQDFVRSAIWDAAVDLFGARGFDRTTIDEIAHAAGVSKRTFFRYFASKNDLMGQGMVTYGTHITEAIRACPEPLPPLDVLRQTVRQVAVTAAAYPRVRKIADIASTSVAAREAQLSRLAELEDRIADAYQARAAARRDGLTARLLAELTLSLLDVTFREWLKRDEADIVPTTDRVFAALLQLVCSASSRRDSGNVRGGANRRPRRDRRPRRRLA